MDRAVAKVATLQTDQSMAVQEMFRRVVAEYGPVIRIAGVVEERETAARQGRTCRAGLLRNITDDVLYPMFQALAPGEAGCDLRGFKVTVACEAVRRDIAAGCDLVVLSKFGKLESAGEGLIGAFADAVEAGIPVLTLIPPAYEQAWSDRIGAAMVRIPAEIEAVRDWLAAVGVPRPAAVP